MGFDAFWVSALERWCDSNSTFGIPALRFGSPPQACPDREHNPRIMQFNNLTTDLGFGFGVKVLAVSPNRNPGCPKPFN